MGRCGQIGLEFGSFSLRVPRKIWGLELAHLALCPQNKILRTCIPSLALPLGTLLKVTQLIHLLDSSYLIV